MLNSKDSKAEPDYGVVISTVELIVTAEMRAALERKRLRRQKVRMLGDEIHSAERGEVDLGDIGNTD